MQKKFLKVQVISATDKSKTLGEIIHEAKAYVKNHSVSLSKLVENYLNSLTRTSKMQTTVNPLVESLTGIIPSEYDEKKDYGKFESFFGRKVCNLF